MSARAFGLAIRALFAASVAFVCAGACGDGSVESPFTSDAGSDAGDSSADAPRADVEPDADPTLGGPCSDDAQCDDGIDCTFDHCDLELDRCRFTPDHGVCADSVYCDGAEVCDPKLGCREGEPEACSDDNTCTIDTCVEATQSCTHELRDADGDGDPDKNCGGGDCNETNPLISSLQAEVCGNAIDDDCDGEVDEASCQSPQYDTCADPLEITQSGSHALSLAAAQPDYAASCTPAGSTLRDVVAAIVVPAGPPIDVDVIAETQFGQLSIAAAGSCGDTTSELACHAGVASLKGPQMARLRLRSLAPGAYPLYVFGSGGTVTLHVKYLPASSPPAHETCGTALALTPGEHVTASVIGVAEDHESACAPKTGELVYELDLSAPSDVDVYAVSLDGWGAPSVAIQSGACSGPEDELTCKTTQPAHLFARALPAGKHAIAVSASAPTDVDLVVELSPPSSAPADETCSGAPPIASGKSVSVTLAEHTDDVQLGCVVGAPDAAYTLDLSAKSDVLLVGRFSQADTAGLLLSKAGCTTGDLVTCAVGGQSPVRAAAYGVAPGSHRAVIETLDGNPTELTAWVRPYAPPIVVLAADTCASAVKIPPSGGRFIGNTANANADYDAGCDLGGQAAGGAPEQMLELTLTVTKRVVFDMKGSGYQTLLDVRKGPSCPGSELPKACAAGYVQDKSFLDLTLDAGQYFVQVDGYAGASGPWQLDVFVADP